MHNKRTIFLMVTVLILLSCGLPTVTIDTGSPKPAQTVIVVEVTATSGIPVSGEQSSADAPPTLDLGPPPPFEAVTFPEGMDKPEQRDGRWYLRDQPVALSYHLNANGEKELWLTRESEPDWPIMIQSQDGTWQAGAKAWNGNVTFINTNDAPLSVTIYTIVEGGSQEELLALELTPYETYNLASMPPSKYVIRFQFQGDELFDLTCAVKLQQDSRMTFAAVSPGVAVSEASFKPQSNSDLDVRYSPLCGGVQ